MILFKVSQFPTYSETFIVQNIVAAIENGYEIKILADQKNPLSYSSQQDLIEKYLLLDKVFTVKSIPKTTFRRWRNLVWDVVKNPLLVFLFFKHFILNGNLNYYLLYLIKEYHTILDAKVIHVHFGDQFKPINDLSSFRLLKGKVVVTFHGYDVELLYSKNRSDIPILNGIASYFIANSEFTKNRLIALGLESKMIKVIFNGIDVSKEVLVPKNLRQEPIRLLSIGRLVEVKGHLFALKSIQELKRNGFKISYTIIGDGIEYENLSSYVNSNGLENNVIFLGQKTQNEIFNQLNLNDIFLFPSTIDSNGRKEGFGVASLEAQLFGLPVIGFDVGGFPETLKDSVTGFIVPDKDYKQMARKIKELVETPDLYKKMSKEAHLHVKQNFNYIDIFSKIDKIYRS
ncbi:glycosyltransferase [Cyclobacterium plantarum]|uniref:glycosyltransferase n=1 Tax=Cyclobacterium plantarum TaxID=2716263 RepID=UPI003F7221E4